MARNENAGALVKPDRTLLCPAKAMCKAVLQTRGFGRGRYAGQVLEGVRCDCPWASKAEAKYGGK